MKVKNIIPDYQDREERDILLQKQYKMLQRRIYEEKKKAANKKAVGGK